MRSSLVSVVSDFCASFIASICACKSASRFSIDADDNADACGAGFELLADDALTDADAEDSLDVCEVFSSARTVASPPVATANNATSAWDLRFIEPLASRKRQPARIS